MKSDPPPQHRFTRSTATLAAAALVVTTLTTSPTAASTGSAIEAESVYFEGLTGYREKRFADAAERFGRVLALDPPPELRLRALQAIARSARELSATDLAAACRIIAPHEAAVGTLSPADDANQQALVDREIVRARCQSADDDAEPTPDPVERSLPRATPPTRPDYTTAWALTSGATVAVLGGAVLGVLALQDRDLRADAVARYEGATSEAQRIEHARAIGQYEGRGESEALWSTALFAAGGLLAVGAIWAWAAPPEVMDSPFALGIGPDGIAISGAF